MLAAILMLCAAPPAGMLLERIVPAGTSREAAGFPWVRIGAHLGVLLVCFGLCWRPLLGAGLYLGLVAALAASSRLKHRIMRENLVFADLFLIRTILRHPRLYYVHLADWRVLAGTAAALLVVGLAVTWEPGLLPSSWGLLAAPLPAVAGLGLMAAVGIAGGRRIGPEVLSDEDASAAIDQAIAAAGLLGSLLALAGAWTLGLGPPDEPAEPQDEAPAAPAGARGRAGMLVIAVQCESFLDPRGRGFDAPPLDAIDRAAARARAFGRLKVPAFAANTMRSEFSFLTGLSNESLGADRFNPFLTAEAYGEAAWPERLRRNGWRTLFVHPYDRHFFERSRVMPALGFERALWAEDFADARRRGPYVSDLAVAERILSEARKETGPTFVFAVTMENHGPWGPGRLPDESLPREQYLHHLAGADAMVAALLEGIDTWPGQAVLCLYGDHVPAIAGLGEEAEAGLTDYLVVDGRESLRIRRNQRAARPLRIESLLAVTLVGLRRNPL